MGLFSQVDLFAPVAPSHRCFDLHVSYIETTGDGESMADFVPSMLIM
jgi:hypothetical protein